MSINSGNKGDSENRGRCEQHFGRGSEVGRGSEEGRKPSPKMAALLAALCTVGAAQPTLAQEPPPETLVAPARQKTKPQTSAEATPTDTEATPTKGRRLRLGPSLEEGLGPLFDTRNLEGARFYSRLLLGLALHSPGSRHTGTVGLGWSTDPGRTVKSPLEGGGPDVFEIPVPEHCLFAEGGDRIGFRPDSVRVQPFFAAALSVGACLRPQVAALVGDKTIGTYSAAPAVMADARLSFGIAVRLLQKEGYQFSLVIGAGGVFGLRASKEGTDGLLIPLGNLGLDGLF